MYLPPGTIPTADQVKAIQALCANAASQAHLDAHALTQAYCKKASATHGQQEMILRSALQSTSIRSDARTIRSRRPRSIASSSTLRRFSL